VALLNRVRPFVRVACFNISKDPNAMDSFLLMMRYSFTNVSSHDLNLF
jgi:hypothetical protein